jgi:hypothetical protein
MGQTRFVTQQLKLKLQDTTEKNWKIEEASKGFESLVCDDDWTITISRNSRDSYWEVTLLSRKADTGVPIENRTAKNNEHLVQVVGSIAEDLSL